MIGRRVELEALHRDGHQFPIELTPWVVRTDESTQFNAFIHDITERKAFEQELQHQSLHDSLTGLPNRALLFFDLDRFKAVNDSFGHEAGDAVLLGVAERVPGALRSGDTLARLSGDEFVVLCEDVDDHHAAEEVAARILEALSAPFPVAGSEAYLSASIGIAMTAGGDTSAENLLADADLAMYRAKERGKGVFELFDERLRVRVTERLTTERALRTAIERDELVAHYQPVVDVVSGRVTGVEALVRWSHPDRGFLPPGSFIPLAESCTASGATRCRALSSRCRSRLMASSRCCGPALSPSFATCPVCPRAPRPSRRRRCCASSRGRWSRVERSDAAPARCSRSCNA